MTTLDKIVNTAVLKLKYDEMIVEVIQEVRVRTLGGFLRLQPSTDGMVWVSCGCKDVRGFALELDKLADYVAENINHTCLEAK